jgi:hypothetical protein
LRNIASHQPVAIAQWRLSARAEVFFFIQLWEILQTNYLRCPTLRKPPNVSGKASIFMNLPVAPFYVMPPDKAAAIKILLYR